MLSIVLAARNDEFGGNFLQRMQLSLNVLDQLCGRHNLKAEVIIVEWNPPTDEKRLLEVLTPPKSIPLYIVTVPSEIHKTINGFDEMPMFEYVAKNVGIRHASGEMILCTNPDIIFSDEMIARFAMESWRPACFYRACRSDLSNGDIPDVEIEQQLALCRKKVDVTHGPFEAAGDFMLMSRADWFDLRGYPELLSHGTLDTCMVLLATQVGMVQVDLGESIFHQFHERFGGRPVLQSLDFRPNEIWGLGDTKLEIWCAQDKTMKIAGSKPTPPPPPPRPNPNRLRCPNCSSIAIGMAGGMRICNQCQHQWAA